MSTSDAVASLIDAAKRLRTIADELGRTDVKAQILDVLVELQEHRPQATLESASSEEPPAKEPTSDEAATETSAAPATALLGGFTQEQARIEPSGELETYAFHLDEPEAPAEKSEEPTSPKEGESEKSAPDEPAAGDAAGQKSDAKPVDELSEEARFALAEQRIAMLEPLHQAALKRMNDVLTPEQAARKKLATKKGIAAGLKGKQLQESVLDVLALTEEQQQAIEKGRHDLHQVRLAISKQVEGLLSKEQLDRLLKSHRH